MRSKTHDLAFCPPLVAEIERVLSRKFRWSADRIAESLFDYLANSISVPISGYIRGVCRDPKDDMVLECAVSSGANLIVTGDRDLLEIDSYRDIRIITARQYLNGYPQA